MTFSPRVAGIVFSLVLSALMIAGAFVLSSNTGPIVADAESTEELLRAYAKQDTDGDLLMDWQESLYGSDPKNPSSLVEGMTDREAVDSGKIKPKFESDTSLLEEDSAMPGVEAAPDTLTDRFARELFTNYLTGNEGHVPTEDELVSFVEKEIDQLIADNTAKSVFSPSQVKVIEGGPEALRTYAAAFERTIGEHEINTSRSELLYFADVVHGRSTTGLTEVRRIGEAYAATADALGKLSVPREEREAHARVVNALSRMGIIVKNMAAFETDPLLAFVHVSAYETSITELALSLGDLYPPFVSAGVTFSEGEEESSFHRMLQIVSAAIKN